MEILVGKVGRAQGIRGEVTLDVRTDEPDRRFAPETVFQTSRGPLTIVATHWHGQRLLARFTEVVDRTGAEALRGVELRLDVDEDERPADPQEFYDRQLVGLAVVSESGAAIGEVAEVLHLPAQDVLIVRRESGDALVPFLTEFVPEIDLDRRQLTVVDRPGLLDDEAEPATEGE